MSYLSLGLLTALCWVFATSGWGKVRSRAARTAFAESLRPMPLLPASLVVPVAHAVTAAELALLLGSAASIVALLLGWSAAQPAAIVVLVSAVLLLAVLTGGVVLAVRRGSGVSCACFGATLRPLGWRHVVRNTVLLAIAVAGLLSVGIAVPAPVQPAGVLVAVAAGSFAALILIRLDDLVDLFLPISAAPPTLPDRRR